MSANSSKPAAWNPWPVSIVVFFSIAIAAAVGFVVFCNSRPSDLVAGDYYEQEVRYQSQMDRATRTKALGDSASVRYESTNHVITIAIPPGHRRDLSSGTVHLYRPSAAGMDRRLELQVDTEGTQRVDAGNLPPGLWNVKVSWKVAGEEFFMDEKVRI
jgi:nitrogen fixation protein FixH